MMSRSRLLFVFFAGIMFGASITVVSGVTAKNSVNKQGLPLDALRTFTDVFARIKNDYVEEVDDKKLIRNAIRGMLTGLDPHSSYLDAKEFRELQIGTSGEFGGLGIEVGMENGFVKVISPIDDTPAKRAGVKAGDLIIRLDSTPVKGMTLNDAVKKMRGKPGTDITITVVREGVAKPLKITITRAVIRVRSVKSKLLDKSYGYIRITQFQSKTAHAVSRLTKKLVKQAGGKLKGLIIDLRNNPGGVLSASVAVSDAFLHKGLIVYTEGRVRDSKLRFSATPGDVINGAPIVVLVNGGSASASEIVAGALQDHGRAVIMGEKTFGKGSVQTILSARGNTAVKLTTARYYTPNGRSIQAKGIVPDVFVEPLSVSRRSSAVRRLSERDLSGHLANPKKGQKKKAGTVVLSGKGKKKKQSLAVKDYQLFQALTLLKGIHVARLNVNGKKVTPKKTPKKKVTAKKAK